MRAAEKVILSWSGGKDSALALHVLQQDPRLEVVGLLTTVSQDYQRISHHGVRDELLDEQSRSIDLPVQRVWLPSGPSHECTNALYESLMEVAMKEIHDRGVRLIAHGDIFLQDLRQYREKNLQRGGLGGLFPLWGRDTQELIREFVALGFRAYVACVDGRCLPRSFAGCPIDDAFAESLPAEVDPCGENGEYHSFVWDGPMFRWPIDVIVGEVVERDTRYFADLMTRPGSETEVQEAVQ